MQVRRQQSARGTSRESVRASVCVCVCVCKRERERESVCVCVQESVCVCGIVLMTFSLQVRRQQSARGTSMGRLPSEVAQILPARCAIHPCGEPNSYLPPEKWREHPA